MTPEERITQHRRLAESYRNAYLREGVKDGEEYTDENGHDAWKFADGAIYTSPYFTGDETILMSEALVDTGRAATMEAKAYSLVFPEWKPTSFEYWPADNGVVWKTRWQGTTVEGTSMGFYSYSFIETNENAEITRWETHVNDEYSPFLEAAIGVSGPFHGNAEYLEALERCLEKAGVTV
ncbi:MAG TPA: hypothetical protein VFN32_00630 [Rhodococcus sp. (in: high G+C Gram-positive bacteria)]|uniref:hypothetical protein n=1 Tax=Rhodococcus sp. SMB37 TaxID=2512213 RepID=UPI001052A602|nr:hypothetical protein [Rhodococcus sp. SMB37]TCN55757.1 hypothetical protein EV641_103104 [Rhodococcus sp. SMB37]HET8992266.1 hypothetical protein [Rhodococcus sp. (in: high G+C Gram-positive bacteria)]